MRSEQAVGFVSLFYRCLLHNKRAVHMILALRQILNLCNYYEGNLKDRAKICVTFALCLLETSSFNKQNM